MKRTVPVIAIFISTAILLFSCANNKELAAERRTALQDSRLDHYDCFVQYTDGSIKNFSSLRLVTGVYKTPHLLADGKIKIYPGEITAYQNKDHFAISSTGFLDGTHKSNLAVETLPGFAVRIAAGHLNVYVKKYKTLFAGRQRPYTCLHTGIDGCPHKKQS
jgi:hypothetical protein